MPSSMVDDIRLCDCAPAGSCFWFGDVTGPPMVMFFGDCVVERARLVPMRPVVLEWAS